MIVKGFVKGSCRVVSYRVQGKEEANIKNQKRRDTSEGRGKEDQNRDKGLSPGLGWFWPWLWFMARAWLNEPGPGRRWRLADEVTCPGSSGASGDQARERKAVKVGGGWYEP
jgi:hypothetical protein